MDNSWKSTGRIDEKIDPVTALQDSIDLFSLSIFESLRQLRDATTTENDRNSDEEDESQADLGYQEREKFRDSSLVEKLASEVLKKSQSIVQRTTLIPGMNRTKVQQFEYIDQLLKKNAAIIQELQDAKKEALNIRDLIRCELQRVTTSALGIGQEP